MKPIIHSNDYCNRFTNYTFIIISFTILISLTILTHEAVTLLLKKEWIKTGGRLFDILKRKNIDVVNPSIERHIEAWNYECHFPSSVPAAIDGLSKPQ